MGLRMSQSDDPVRKVIYSHEDDTHYMRVYANTAFVQTSPQNELVIDFCEEYVKPICVMEYTITEPAQTVYSNDQHPNEVHVKRVFKTTVTLSRDVAIRIAKIILQNYSVEDES
jgi:hypothetical protein